MARDNASQGTGLRDLARSIGTNAKGEKLIAALPKILDQIVAKGGERKVVIFTESVRTQRAWLDKRAGVSPLGVGAGLPALTRLDELRRLMS